MSGAAAFDHERTDIKSTTIAWLAVGLALFVIATPLLMPLIFPQSMRERTPSAPPALSANAPRLEIAPGAELRNIERSQAALVNSYGWTDRSRGLVRVPVRRAMELIAQRGLEGWPRP
jgi:hypothetical protein